MHEAVSDNWDWRRFGPERNDFSAEAATNELLFVLANFDHFDWLYGILADQSSREYLVRYLLYKVLGHRHVKLPHVTGDFWETFCSVEGYQSSSAWEIFPSQWLPVPIRIHDYCVPFHGDTLNVSTSDVSMLEVLLLEQYRYRGGAFQSGLRKDCVVIDAGACWGDSSLAFASIVGSGGRVYAFEMIEENLRLFHRNLRANPRLAGSIEVVESPLAASAGVEYWVIPHGAASTLATRPAPGSTKVISTTIDQFVGDRRLQRVDFIKMDIEGAERDALAGAAETIRAFRPVLAISVYHRTDDILMLPLAIHKIHPGYRFYLQGVSLNYGESVLFCAP